MSEIMVGSKAVGVVRDKLIDAEFTIPIVHCLNESATERMWLPQPKCYRNSVPTKKGAAISWPFTEHWKATILLVP